MNSRIQYFIMAIWLIGIVVANAESQSSKPAEAPPKMVQVPTPPKEVSEAIADKWIEWQGAIIAQQKAEFNTQTLQRELTDMLEKARVSQGVPPDCLIKKEAWVKPGGQNGYMPCVVPEHNPEKK